MSKMADKCDDFEVGETVGETKSWTLRRSEIRSSSRINDNVRISLQSLDALQMKKRLAGIAADIKSQYLRKDRKMVGMIHLLDELLAADDLHSGKGRSINRRSEIDFSFF